MDYVPVSRVVPSRRHSITILSESIFSLLQDISTNNIGFLNSIRDMESGKLDEF